MGRAKRGRGACCCVLFLLAACTDPHAPAPVGRLDCFSCHESEFDGAQAHETENAGHSCWTCHGTMGWYPVVPVSHDGTRRHTWFRIETGDHAGYDCWQCHVETTPDVTFDDPVEGAYSCTGCHAHTAGRTDPLHLGIDDYDYGPKTCRRCHGHGGDDD